MKNNLMTIDNMYEYVTDHSQHIVEVEKVPIEELKRFLEAYRNYDILDNMASFGVFGNVGGDVPESVCWRFLNSLMPTIPNLSESFKVYQPLFYEGIMGGREKHQQLRDAYPESELLESLKPLLPDPAQHRFSERMLNADCEFGFQTARESYRMLDERKRWSVSLDHRFW